MRHKMTRKVTLKRGEDGLKIRQRLIRYSVYRNMFLSFLLLTSLIIAIVCSILFALFSWSTAGEVGRISESMLKQNSFVSHVIRNQVYNAGNHLLSDKAIVTAMFSKEKNRIEEYNAANAIRKLQLTFPFIQMIGIYNGFSEEYINTKGVTTAQENELLDKLRAGREAYFNFFPRQVMDPVDGKLRNVLTFVLFPGYNSYLPSKGAIVINVDEAYIQTMIGGYKNYSTSMLYVMDDQGIVLTHSDPGYFMENLSAEAYVGRILEEPREAGHFDFYVDGDKYLASFEKSSEMNWVFVSVSRYSDLLSNMNLIRRATLAIAVSMFLICFLASVWLTNRTYNPLGRLLDKNLGQQPIGLHAKRVNEYDLLETTFADIRAKLNSMESAVTVAHRADLLHRLKGSQLDFVRAFAESWEGPFFLVILLKIDSLHTFQRLHSAQTQAQIEYAICRIAQEMLERESSTQSVVIEDGEIGIVLQLPEPAYPVVLISLLEEIQVKIRGYCKVSLTVGIGPVVSTADRIRESYDGACESIRYRFYEGKGRIFEYRDQDRERFPGDAAYPDRQEKKILDAIRMGNRQYAAAETAQFMRLLKQFEYSQAIFFLNQLISSLYKQFGSLNGKEQSGSELLLGLIKDLPAHETLEEIEGALQEAAESLCHCLEETAHHQHAEIIETICSYVNEHYSKPDLSLEWMAGEVNLSRGYLGKLFKSRCLMSFNDYLNSVRLEKAKQLLRETDEPIQQISERVGIYNTTYFYTLFKKMHQMSPAQYRNRMNNNLKSKTEN